MKGKITERGSLMIERAGKMKQQLCPYSLGEPSFNCGDPCPLFGEPEEYDNKTLLTICNDKVLVFDEFTDERGTE